MDFLRDLISGALTGLTVEGVLFPLDNLKCRLQAKEGIPVFQLHTLYNGFLPTLIGSVPATATFFCFYELTKKKLTESNKIQSDNCVYVVSACVANVFVCLVRLPFEIVKHQMQVSADGKMKDAILNLYEKEALPQFLLRSYASLLIREIPADCIQFFLWENFKKKAKQHCEYSYDKYPTMVNSLCGALAGGLTGFITAPIDTIKSRQIVYEGTYSEVIQELYKEGIFAFYKGALMRTLYMGIGGAIFYGCFTYFTLTLKRTSCFK